MPPYPVEVYVEKIRDHPDSFKKARELLQEIPEHYTDAERWKREGYFASLDAISRLLEEGEIQVSRSGCDLKEEFEKKENRFS